MSAVSTLARPPIQAHETVDAPHSICVYHGGLIAESGDVEGRVFWCPVGRQFWRYSRNPGGGMYAPLNYQHEKPI